LHTLILSRIDQLSEGEKTTLRVASIVGRLFRADWLAGYYPDLGGVNRVQTDLEQLAEMDIMAQDLSEPELAYLFKHIVTHEVTYESLPFATRARLHEQLAAYLERQVAVGTLTESFAEGEGVNGEALYLLLTAAWFHDLGFIEQWIGHEATGARMAAEVLPGFGYSQAEIQIIKGIIISTVVPQSPGTILEKIIADADLDLLGRDDFMFLNGNLRRERAFFGKDYSDLEWYSGQLRFVESHQYFTASARALRDAGKLKNNAELKRRLEEVSAEN